MDPLSNAPESRINNQILRGLAKTSLFLVLLFSIAVFVIGSLGIDNQQVSAQVSDDSNLYLPFVIRPAQPTPTPTPVFPPNDCGNRGGDWAMVAANPERTSWTSEEVCGNLGVNWYRPIEAYIPQQTQLIAANGLLYVSTARGLYALNIYDGSTAWQYDTALPLGNSPTIHEGVAYVGGHDNKIHAVDAINGAFLWTYNGAEAGFATNPLVVDGKIIAGNRDGYMYAIGAHGTGNQGQLIWRFKTNGQINFSAAYHNGIVYFASDDNHAYAVDGNNGGLVWKSAKLPGDGFHSFWPVVFQDKVIFTTASRYRIQRAGDPGNEGKDIQLDFADLFPDGQDGSFIGEPVSPAPSWALGNPVIDASRITEYQENHQGDPGTSGPHVHKPWRRVQIVLNQTDGTEFTFDSDNDGWPEYMPYTTFGKDGNFYPPVLGADGILYAWNLYEAAGGFRARVMGWNIDSPSMLSVLDTWDVMAEPAALSAGGNMIYRVTCCDRKGTMESIYSAGNYQALWEYFIDHMIPEYDDMWAVPPSAISRHKGWYTGDISSENGIFHNHGNNQNALIPYQGMLFVHRSNTIIAFGPGSNLGKLPALMINNASDQVPVPSNGELIGRLENEIQKIIDAGFLRPAYVTARVGNYNQLDSYFQNPGETLLALSLAYPHLNPGLQSQLQGYLNNYYNTYFSDNLYGSTGWANLAARESMPLPDDILDEIPSLGPRPTLSQYTWSYPPHNLYALYKYAQNVPGVNVLQVYDIAKGILKVPANILEETYLFDRYPYENNAWISGYEGFLKLQDLARTAAADPNLDASLRSSVVSERDRMLTLRYNLFDKDTPWITEEYNFYKKMLDVARNFMYLVPEVGDHYRQNILSEVNAAIAEYDYVAPYWFISRFENAPGENGRQNLYTASAMFQAKAYILQESRQDLYPFLDAPTLERGDLFYIQNLVAVIEAP